MTGPRQVRTARRSWSPPSTSAESQAEGGQYFDASGLIVAPDPLAVAAQGLVPHTFVWAPLSAAAGTRPGSGVSTIVMPYHSCVVAMTLSASTTGSATFTAAGAMLRWTTGTTAYQVFGVGDYDVLTGATLSVVASNVSGSPNVEVTLLLAQASTD